jgi:hypothetical protein
MLHLSFDHGRIRIVAHMENLLMKMYRRPTNLLIALAIAVLSLTAVLVAAAQSPDNAAPLQVEVAEDGARFVFDDLNLYEDGMPAYGSAFVTQGYIYPAGTLNGSNGVLENGEPEFPELVLGEWTCYGWMIGEGARTETGEWVVSTQIYKFNDGSMIVTDGFEIADFDQPVTRAISSGTGEYRSASGEMVQVLRGFTDAMGVNLSVSFDFDSE